MVEVVDEGNATVLPTFRVARFVPPSTFEVANEDLLKANVGFVKDDYFNSYGKINAQTNERRLKGTKQLFLDLYKTMANAGPDKGDVLFFIHGFNSGWTDSLALLQKLHKLYVEPRESRINQIVLYSWPSHGKLIRFPSLKPRAYLDDQEIARQSGELLGRIFGKVLRFYADIFDEGRDDRFEHCGNRIHLAAHSMGNQVLEEFIASISRHFQYTLFSEAVLLNADIPWTALEKDQPLYRLGDYCERIHIYNHKSDDALLVSERNKNGNLLRGNKRLGKYGPHDLSAIPNRAIVVDTTKTKFDGVIDEISDPYYLAALESIKQFKIPGEQKERIADHWGFLYRPAVIGDLMSVLGGRSTTANEYESTRSKMGPNLFRLTG